MYSPDSHMPQEPVFYKVELIRLPDLENSALFSPPKIETELIKLYEVKNTPHIYIYTIYLQVLPLSYRLLVV